MGNFRSKLQHTPDPEWLDDDNRVDVYALFVLEDIPHFAINEVLQKNADEMSDCFFLWLADTYQNLPAITDERTMATRPPIDPSWSSPFLGKTLDEAARFVKNAPKPLCGVFFAVPESEAYENNMIRLCKIVAGEVQSFLYSADQASLYFIGHDRDTWEDDWLDFRDL